jgi:hypothetical protein
MGQCLSLDTFLTALSATAGAPFPKPKMEAVTWSPVPLYEDNDLSRGLNLLQVPTLDSTPYAKVTFQGPPVLRVLVAADSYYDQIYHQYSDQMFQRSSYWFYLDEIHGKERGMIADSLVRVQDEIAGHDVVVLFLSTNNLLKMPRKFLREFHTWYSSQEYYNWKMARYIDGMKGDPAWLESLRVKAEQQGVPLDTVMRRDAEYLWRMGK